MVFLDRYLYIIYNRSYVTIVNLLKRLGDDFLDPSVATQLIILFVLLLLSAFFSSAETSLLSVNKLRIRSLMDDNVKGAATIYKLIDDPSKMLSTVLIGNNIVNLSASSLTATLAGKYLGSVGIGIATGVLTMLILIFGEITPKTMATIYAEKLAFIYAPIITFISKLLTPVIFVVNKLAMGFMFLLRIDPTKKQASITETELRAIVNVSHEEGVIESEERKMITNVVDFGDSLAKDIMIPRIDMAFVNIDMTYDELIEAFHNDKYSRMPVYSKTRDNVVGIINLKDFFFYREDKDKFDIQHFLRTPYFTYEFKKTSELLNELRKVSVSMAIVLDEYGATAGMITIEDLLEEIVGEIRDEYDGDEVDVVRPIGSNEYVAEGTARLEDINEMIGLKLESEDYESIAGHIINLLDRLPLEGEQITENNVTFRVVSVVKNRIDQVHIKVNPVQD